MRARVSPTLLLAVGLAWWFARGGALDAQFTWPLCLVSHLVELGAAVAVGLALLLGRLRAGVLPSACALLVLGAFALSALRSPLPRLALERLPPLLLFLAAFVAACADGGERALHLLAMGAILPLLVGLMQIPESFVGGARFTVKGVPRIFSTFNHPNDFAFFLAALLPVAVGLALTSPPSGKVLFWPFAGLISLCLLFTLSRGGWLGGLVGVGALLFAVRGRLSRRALKGLLAGALVGAGLVAGVAIALGFGRVLVERLLGAFSPRDPTAASRLLMWGRSLALFVRRPLTGFGPGMFGLVYPSAMLAGDLPFVSLHAHNAYVHLLVEQGVLGFFSLALVLSLSLWALKAGGGAKVAAGAGAAAVAVASIFNHIMEVPSIGLLVWALLGAALSAPGAGRAGAALSRLLGAVAALGGLVLLPVIVKVDIAHGLYDKAREWRLPPLRARDVLERATRLDPSMAVYWAALGEASFRAGLGPSEFLRPLTKAIAIAPFDPWLRRLHYWALYRAGRVEAAAREAEGVAERLYPASGLFRCDAAWLLDRAGRRGEALRLLRAPVHLTQKAGTESLLSSLLEEHGWRAAAAMARERALHALRYYRPPSPSPFTAPYLRRPFESRLPAFEMPAPEEVERGTGRPGR